MKDRFQFQFVSIIIACYEKKLPPNLLNGHINQNESAPYISIPSLVLPIFTPYYRCPQTSIHAPNSMHATHNSILYLILMCVRRYKTYTVRYTIVLLSCTTTVAQILMALLNVSILMNEKHEEKSNKLFYFHAHKLITYIHISHTIRDKHRISSSVSTNR